MSKSFAGLLFSSFLAFVVLSFFLTGPTRQFQVVAQTSYPDPANEHACPSQTGAGVAPKPSRHLSDQGVMASVPTRACACVMAIDAATLPAAGSLVPTDSANIAAQIKVDHNTSNCPSRVNLYVAFVAPDNATENSLGKPLRSVYVGVSTNASQGLGTFTFTDHKAFTSPAGSLGATNGAANIFPVLAVDNFGHVYTVWSDTAAVQVVPRSEEEERKTLWLCA